MYVFVSSDLTFGFISNETVFSLSSLHELNINVKHCHSDQYETAHD